MLRDLSYKAMTMAMAEPFFANSYFSTLLQRKKGLTWAPGLRFFLRLLLLLPFASVLPGWH